MTQLLERAYQEIARLPEPDQDAIAAIILDEIASDQRWREAFASSQDVLAEMAREAIEEHRAGKTLPLDPDQL